jgi:flagellar basal body rod protein FlgG
MFRALYTAASGMMSQQMNLDNVANNLANSSTAGFRRRRLQFQDLLYQNLIMPGAAATQQTTIAARNLMHLRSPMQQVRPLGQGVPMGLKLFSDPPIVTVSAA